MSDEPGVEVKTSPGGTPPADPPPAKKVDSDNVPSDVNDDSGVPWKNRAKEYERKLEEEGVRSKQKDELLQRYQSAFVEKEKEVTPKASTSPTNEDIQSMFDEGRTVEATEALLNRRDDSLRKEMKVEFRAETDREKADNEAMKSYSDLGNNGTPFYIAVGRLLQERKQAGDVESPFMVLNAANEINRQQPGLHTKRSSADDTSSMDEYNRQQGGNTAAMDKSGQRVSTGGEYQLSEFEEGLMNTYGLKDKTKAAKAIQKMNKEFGVE